jgi:chromosome partitioning protein
MVTTKQMHEQEIMGLQEFAVLAKVTRAAVGNWRKRFKDFPKPIAQLAAGPVFRRDQVLAWLKRKRKPMATVISMINLKGGVAKTTTTVALAQLLDCEFEKRVLIIDLDPQTNATVMLIGDKKWRELNQKRHTIAQLFEDAISGKKTFDLDATLQKRVGAVSDSQRVDLIPSSLDLIDIQDRLGQMDPGKFHALTPIEVLRRALRSVLEEDAYDFVLIDCPPSLGLVTLNGLRISDYYLIPTIPDFLSTYGIPQIVKRVGDFSDAAGHSIEPMGILATKYRAQSSVHNQQLSLLKQGKDAPLLNTVVPENSEIAGAAEFRQASTLRQKWGYRGQFDIYRSLAKEVIESVEVPAGV